MPRKLTHHYYEQVARDRDFEWLSETVPQNITKKTTWRCPEGHTWEAAYINVKHGGTGCPHCSNQARKKQEDYQRLGRQFGFVWLGPVVRNTQTKTKWRCPENHCWKATYSSIRLGYGCPYCAQTAPKTADDYYALAEARGFEWLGSSAPATTKIKTKWRCTKNHTWEAAYSWILSGSGCPRCAGNEPKTEADYYALAKQSGFVWLGPMVKNVRTKTQWRCGNNHTWFATYSRIQQGSGCPACAGNKRKLEADYHALATRRGIEWLGPLPKNVREKSKWRCGENHTWLATYNEIELRGKCPICGGSNHLPKTEADYHALAKQRGIKWLGPMVKNTKTRTEWQCSKGHAWFTTYNSIQQGTRCGPCRRLERKKKAK